MSGHSKWSTIKHQKGVTDVRRGQLFTKLMREITVAVREGGPNPEPNYRLRLAIQKAKDNNMPLDTIERGIKRANGAMGDTQLEEALYEGYGPGGVAIMALVFTDNRNRTASEVRQAFSRHGSTLGEAGCVSWNFEPKGIITLDVASHQAEETALMAIDAGADDVKQDDAYLEVHTSLDGLETVRTNLELLGITIFSAEPSRIPKTTVPLDDASARQALKLLDALEELSDVQKVYSNGDFPDTVLEEYSPKD